jgi:hypothetical protein
MVDHGREPRNVVANGKSTNAFPKGLGRDRKGIRALLE